VGHCGFVNEPIVEVNSGGAVRVGGKGSRKQSGTKGGVIFLSEVVKCRLGRTDSTAEKENRGGTWGEWFYQNSGGRGGGVPQKEKES